MHETIETLKTRRSCRAYQPRQVEEGLLQQVLEAGLYAPSGRGAQPVVFVVVQDQATLAELSRRNAAVMGADTDPFYGAPTVIVVLADRSRPTWVEDGSLALGNLMNAAHALGLGSCWIHRAREVFDSPEGQALLHQWGLEGTYAGVGHCILGSPAADLPPRPGSPAGWSGCKAPAPDPERDRNRKPYQHPTPPSRTSAWGRCCVQGRGAYRICPSPRMMYL